MEDDREQIAKLADALVSLKMAGLAAQQRKASYRKKRADNQALRNLILTKLPIGKGKRGVKCQDIALQIDRGISGKKVSQMVRVLYVQGKAKQRHGYWKRTIPKSKPIF